jgi:hypothetical protein
MARPDFSALSPDARKVFVGAGGHQRIFEPEASLVTEGTPMCLAALGGNSEDEQATKGAQRPGK